MAKIKDLRAKTDDELNEQIIALKKESMNLRFQQTSGQLTNTARMRQVKREVAQIKTLLTERKTGSKEK
ncbi:MAG: 50S ribosomal protein L29 [Alphaproteobacteria bacterium]|jgi:large subunit ribosomal protein L29|nr:50S ribosomal protein L29 [Alphaproteobacteria bacterium]